jgi:predicted ribosome quality control (RQC) complex YloA/Tae2 family protein
LGLPHFDLLRTGRHFRLSDQCKAVVGRDNSDNEKILAARADGESTLRWLDGSSPIVLLVGEPQEIDLNQAGRILLRYTKAPKGESAHLSALVDGQRSDIFVVNDLAEDELERLRIM